MAGKGRQASLYKIGLFGHFSGANLLNLPKVKYALCLYFFDDGNKTAQIKLKKRSLQLEIDGLRALEVGQDC